MDIADSSTRLPLPQELVFVDLETTGGSPASHRVIEVGLVRFRAGALVEEWSSLIDPETPIPGNIEAFTGISNAMVRGAPLFSDLAPLLMDKLRGALFVAHNARFDYSFMRREFWRLKMDFEADVLCTVKLSRRLYPQHVRHNLDALMERHDITGYPRHRALGDAQVLREFWIKVCGSIPATALTEALEGSLLKRPRLPAHLSAHLIEELPEGAGVYRYFGEQNELLYVGKATSLRQRIVKQLGEARPGSRDDTLAGSTRRIDWFESAGELGMLLRESALLRLTRPLFNRGGQQPAAAATLKLREEGGGRVDIVAIEDLCPAQLTASFGLFRSSREARKALGAIAQAHRLCLQVLGLESGEGACIAAQFGRCKGACVGQEAPVLHRMRTEMALSRLKLKAWPFPGRIAIRECGTGLEELHVLDHWCYVGSARCEEDLASLQQASCCFDADVYRALVRYFSVHARLDWRSLRSS